MDVIQFIQWGLFGQLLINTIITMVMSTILVTFLIKRPKGPSYNIPESKDDEKTKANNAHEYDRFESDKYIWKQRIKATGAMTAVLITLFSAWSLFIVYLGYSSKNGKNDQTAAQHSEANEEVLHFRGKASLTPEN